MTERMPIGQRLIQAGYIDVWQLKSALAFQRSWGCRLGEALVELKFVTESVLLTELAKQHAVPYVVIGERDIPTEVIRRVPEKLVRSRKLLPIAFAAKSRRGLLVVATSEPNNVLAMDEVAFATGADIQPAQAGGRDIERAIERHLGPTGGRAALAHVPALNEPARYARIAHI